MSTIEQVVEQIRAAASADFAFLLTRRGRLCTRGAPRDMPEAGRLRLVTLAEPLLGTDDVGELTLPREALVPFGGAAPVDVYVAVVAEKAILCAVMSSWATKGLVIPAMKAGLVALSPILDVAVPVKAALRPAAEGPSSAKRRRIEAPPEPRPSDAKPPASEPPDAKPPLPRPPDSRAGGKGKRTTSGLLSVSGPTTHASRELEQAPQIKSVPPPPRPEPPRPAPRPAPVTQPAREGSLPSITVGEATLGRESLAAIEAEEQAEGREQRSSLPAITVGEATLGRESLAAIEAEQREEGREQQAEGRERRSSLPAITVGEATLGRESLAAIEAEMRPPLASAPDEIQMRPPLASAPDEIRISLASVSELPPASASSLPSARATRPWVESAEDGKRAADAAARPKQKAAPPSEPVAPVAPVEPVEEEKPADTLTSVVATQRGMPPSVPRPSKRRG